MSDGAGTLGSVPPARVRERPLWLWAALATALISIPSLFSGFSSDDLGQRLVLERRVPGYDLGPLELYDFTPPRFDASRLIEAGTFPWFASPELSLRFLRPLTSASLALDHVLFGRNAMLSHLQSLAWMVLLAAVASSLFTRWFSPRAALHASLVFALSTAHGTATAWLASRHTLLGACFGVLALWAWVRHREERFALGQLLAPAFAIASVLSSESSLVAITLLVCYEVATRGVRRGLGGALPFVLIGLGYLLCYVGLGYGARGSSFYVSPFSAPIEYLRIALWSVPALCVELLLAVPSALAAFVPAARAPFVVVGLGACVALGALLYRRRAELSLEARRTLCWLAAGSFIGLFALIGAPVTGRVLPLPALGAAALIGNGLSVAASLARPRVGGGERHRRRRWWAVLVPLLLFHYGLSPLLRVAQALQFRKMADDQRQLAEQADVGSCGDRGSLYLLTGADATLSLYTAAALRFYTPEKGGAERLRVLGMAPQPVRFERSGPNTVSLEVLDLPHRDNPFERLYRPAEDPLPSGARIELPELTASVEAQSAGVFNRARFDFRQDLAALPACWLVWQAGRLTTIPLPGLGEGVTLPYEVGPMGM